MAKYSIKPIELGLRVGDNVQVLSGLMEAKRWSRPSFWAATGADG